MEEAPISLRVTAKKEASQLDFESRRLRWMCVLLAACQAVLFLLLAGANYPFIVIADSDLGVDAMARVDGWLRLAGACLLAGVVIGVGNFITWLARAWR